MAEQVKKAWYKKWWVWVIAILVLAGIGSAISGGGSSSKESAQNDAN